MNLAAGRKSENRFWRQVTRGMCRETSRGPRFSHFRIPHPDVVTALQALALSWVTFSWGFTPGCHMAGLQPLGWFGAGQHRPDVSRVSLEKFMKGRPHKTRGRTDQSGGDCVAVQTLPGTPANMGCLGRRWEAKRQGAVAHEELPGIWVPWCGRKHRRRYALPAQSMTLKGGRESERFGRVWRYEGIPSPLRYAGRRTGRSATSATKQSGGEYAHKMCVSLVFGPRRRSSLRDS